MITDFILNLIFLIPEGVLGFLHAILGDWTFPSEAQTAITWYFNQIGGWNNILPLDTIITIFGFILLIEFTEFGFRVFGWFGGWIRGVKLNNESQ